MAKTSLTLRKRGDSFVVDGGRSPAAALKFGRGMQTGTITVDGRALPIAAHGPMRTGATLGGDEPVLRLDGHGAFVPPRMAPVEWRYSRPRRGRYHAALVRGSDVIDFSVTRFSGKAVEITVGGDWDQLELVVLAGSFALLSRRRGDAYRTMTIVGAIGPHAR
ncbi:hypothetical protein OKJ48_02385 [Streptomyces kunmingensis]|uniref:Uncharacterized protein n=1 Tax=Streptomyces kunmingensis TaxID=68225 RepID=A0ABU6C321_9ACTN|nr:hypothetical protein [Streptomyces kunmingensis]MEB3959110.1 hypothetical protein [Streptomyces kunmingensis]